VNGLTEIGYEGNGRLRKVERSMQKAEEAIRQLVNTWMSASETNYFGPVVGQDSGTV